MTNRDAEDISMVGPPLVRRTNLVHIRYFNAMQVPRKQTKGGHLIRTLIY